MRDIIENLKPLEEIKVGLENKKRVIYFDILNILACISVIFLHMNGIVHGYSDTRAWKTALIFEVVCYWAVPVFVMLSGATLLRYRERYDTKTFFKKRFIKVLIPWLIWSLIVYMVKNKNINILKFVQDFLYGRIESVYWFFPLILYLYCLIPIFSIFTEKEEYNKILKAIVVFIFVFAGFINPLCTICNINVPTIFSYCLTHSSYIMFLILGYLLSTTDIPKNKKNIIYMLGIFSILIRYGYTYYMSTKDGILNKDLFNYCSAISVFLAVAVFVFIKSIDWEKITNKLHIKSSVITQVSGCSFGIYLIHMLVKSRLTNLLGISTLSIWYRTIGAIILYLICLLIVFIIKRIPFLKKIVP